MVSIHVLEILQCVVLVRPILSSIILGNHAGTKLTGLLRKVS